MWCVGERGARNIFLRQKIKELYLETCTYVSQLCVVDNSVYSEFAAGRRKTYVWHQKRWGKPSRSVPQGGGGGEKHFSGSEDQRVVSRDLHWRIPTFCGEQLCLLRILVWAGERLTFGNRKPLAFCHGGGREGWTGETSSGTEDQRVYPWFLHFTVPTFHDGQFCLLRISVRTAERLKFSSRKAEKTGNIAYLLTSTFQEILTWSCRTFQIISRGSAWQFPGHQCRKHLEELLVLLGLMITLFFFRLPFL